MKHALTRCALAIAAAGALLDASAAVTATTGTTPLAAYSNRADFELNTTVATSYTENRLQFNIVNGVAADSTNGCGFGGLDCYDNVSTEISSAFSGNYFAAAGNNAYISIALASGKDFQAIQFAVASGFLNAYGYWQTYNDGVLTGSGNLTGGNGTLLSLADASGIDEVRYYSFATANKSSGYSAPDIDAVRVSAVPEPSTWGMLAAGLGLLGWMRRRGGSRQA
jgi:hypothetical protein